MIGRDYERILHLLICINNIYLFVKGIYTNRHPKVVAELCHHSWLILAMNFINNTPLSYISQCQHQDFEWFGTVSILILLKCDSTYACSQQASTHESRRNLKLQHEHAELDTSVGNLAHDQQSIYIRR